jgi:hypothetical protein
MIRCKPGQGAWPLRLAKTLAVGEAVAPAYFAGRATDKSKRPSQPHESLRRCDPTARGTERGAYPERAMRAYAPPPGRELAEALRPWLDHVRFMVEVV